MKNFSEFSEYMQNISRSKSFGKFVLIVNFKKEGPSFSGVCNMYCEIVLKK